MLKFFIQGKKDGLYDLDLETDSENMTALFPEFFGKVTLKGKLRIYGKRYALEAIAECKADLLCDLSLESYTESILADIKQTFIADQTIYKALMDSDVELVNENQEMIVSEGEKFLDFTELVAEELSVNLPLKRIAPEYRGKDFEDIYPEINKKREEQKENDSIDDRWSALKNLKIN